jgi:hypothetical protein
VRERERERERERDERRETRVTSERGDEDDKERKK